MSDQGYGTPGMEQMGIKRKPFSFKILLRGSTTEGSITADILNCPDVTARVWLSSQSATAPSAANFSGLTSAAAPSVIGIYLDVGNAKYLHEVVVPANSIKSASMTAGVVTNKGASHAITGNTGVTSDKDIAFQISCTTLDLDSAAVNTEFDVFGSYSVE